MAPRAFPSHTLAELKANVSKQEDPDKKSRMEAEIKAREAGTSQHKVTPQVKWDAWGGKGERTITKAELDTKVRRGEWEVVWEPDRNGRATIRKGRKGREETIMVSNERGDSATKLTAIADGLSGLERRADALCGRLDAGFSEGEHPRASDGKFGSGGGSSSGAGKSGSSTGKKLTREEATQGTKVKIPLDVARRMMGSRPNAAKLAKKIASDTHTVKGESGAYVSFEGLEQQVHVSSLTHA